MNNKERKGEKKSLYNDGFEICHEICDIIHILTLLVNFTKYIRKADVYTSLLNYVSEQMRAYFPSLHFGIYSQHLALYLLSDRHREQPLNIVRLAYQGVFIIELKDYSDNLKSALVDVTLENKYANFLPILGVTA